MRYFLTFILLMSLQLVHAQITNASFEQWQPVAGVSGAEDPTGWTSNNIICDTVVGYAIQKSIIAHTGNYALEIRPSCNLNNFRYASITLGAAVVDTLAANLYQMNADCSGDSILNNPPFILAGYYQYKAGSPQSQALCDFSLKSVQCRVPQYVRPAYHFSYFRTTTSSNLPTSVGYVPFAVPLRIQADSLPELHFMEIAFQFQHQDTLGNDSRFLLIDDLCLHGNLLTVPSENLATLIEVYPNPVSRTLMLQKPGFIAVEKMALYNSKGELVVKTTSWQAQLDVSDLPPGLYMLQLESSAGLLTKRVLKS